MKVRCETPGRIRTVLPQVKKPCRRDREIQIQIPYNKYRQLEGCVVEDMDIQNNGQGIGRCNVQGT